MKNLIYIKIILFVFCMNVTGYAFSNEDTLKGHIKGTVTDIGVGHKLFVGKGTLEKYGSMTVEIDYFIDYETKYNGKVVSGSSTLFKFSGNNELYIEVSNGKWYVDFVPDPPEVIFELVTKIVGGKGVFKNARGLAICSGIQLYIPNTPTVMDFTIYVNY